MITKGEDGFLRIDLPSIGMVTYTRDLDDACEAIGEACLVYHVRLMNIRA